MMGIFGVGLPMVTLFAVLGLLIGVLFGFSGIGAFFVAPVMLVMGYSGPVAVGSTIAFISVTAVLGTFKHARLGQVDYIVGIVMVVIMTAGFLIGREILFILKAFGIATLLVSISHLVLMMSIGLFMWYDAHASARDETEVVPDGGVPGLADRLRQYQLPPMVTVTGGTEVSLWLIAGIGVLIALPTGALGIGGGFVLIPALMYVLGVPAAAAVGTNALQTAVSGAAGTYLYLQAGIVAVPIVGAMLAGSTFGVYIGAISTTFVSEQEVKSYFTLMLLLGSVAIGTYRVGVLSQSDLLKLIGGILVFGALVLGSGAIVSTSFLRWRE